MDELREKVANRIFATGMLREREGGDAALWEAALKMTDFVLELPEIAEALAAMNEPDVPPLTNEQLRRALDTISTNKRTQV